MFSNLKQLFNRSNKDLRKRIYFTLFCLGVFAFGSTITLSYWPNLKNSFEALDFLQIFNLMSGGGLEKFSIFALGVSPYITASIITQLLQMDVIPYFKELKEQGYTGKQKINRITRYIGVLFGFVQGYIFTVMYSGSNDILLILKSTLVITAGTCLLLWIGDQITKKGIGNGLSLLIMAGIIQSMPDIFTKAYTELTKLGDGALGIAIFASFVIVYLLIIVGMVWIQLAERRIPIQYANRTNSAYGKNQNFLPIRINSAGVIPVIFASTLIAIPVTIINVINNPSAVEFSNKYLQTNTAVGFLIYVLLIMFFGYFYTFLQMNPEEMSKNLRKSGAYIPGVRPGNDTIDYISNVLGKLTIVGSIFLVIIAGLPILFSTFTGLDQSITIGGTGLLIVVGVAIETYKQLESSLISRSHRAGIKR